ncbi:glycosyltransferase [Cruoricaptor ignavus]|uniref:Glycosyltransferase n=1 Tax=Cruoricaptor ignavus TaxID=1118202 RepID=A0A7M1T2J3_9FLAO|nr:glycosyltransferase [Cruoricaptor ignavus]QOR73364.1 glycosyltransferase [Cruoricaptor ignavus]
MTANRKKTKILFRHRSMEMGGVEKVMLSLLNNLDWEKFEMAVLLSLNQGELRDDFPKAVRKVFLAKGREDLSKNPLIQKIQLFLRQRKLARLNRKPEIIDKEILKDSYDVEIAMTYNDFPMVLNSSNKNSKKIGWFHSDITVPKLQPKVPQILGEIPKFDFFIFGSKQSKDIFTESYPHIKLPPNEILRNPIPIDEIKSKSLAEIPVLQGDKIFVSVNRLHSRKGFHKLISAHAKLIADGYSHHIYIVGDGEERASLEEQIKKLKVENTFHLLGTKTNPYPYIKNADYFIMPSESEGWPLVIADALILKKPILATNVGGIPEMITHEKTGYLMNYDEQSIYDGMKNFLTNPELLQTINENLRNSEEMFDNQKIFDKIEGILLNLAEK